MRFAVRLNPLSYRVDGLRGVLNGGFGFEVATNFAVLGGLPQSMHAPLGLGKPSITPSGTANEILSTAVKSSKRLTRSRASMILTHHGLPNNFPRPGPCFGRSRVWRFLKARQIRRKKGACMPPSRIAPI